MAEERAEENWQFRAFLKQLDMASEELDAIVHQMTAEVSAQIDCTQCANCCKQVRPILDDDDISAFAAGLKTSVPELKESYLILDDDDPSMHVFNELPCPFLRDNRCSNYGCRPNDCSSYPHLHKKRFVSRLWSVIENYAICPIVFNVYERLKIELWQDDGFDEMEEVWGW